MSEDAPKYQLKTLDVLLQRWRIAKAKPFVVDGRRVLDVGCFDGAFFRAMGNRIQEAIGIDREPTHPPDDRSWKFINGSFPEVVEGTGEFSAIVMLAVFEHVPAESRTQWAEACARLLVPGGRVIITVPSPLVDPILDLLVFLRIAQGMDLENHSHLFPSEVPKCFQAAGLELVRAEKFQLGLNNLFVFEKSSTTERPPERSRA